ncbi:MAG: S41 family peptidase [Bacteroidales bacterium]|nr:S41 family peptidase [Bacteroidales bacterium]
MYKNKKLSIYLPVLLSIVLAGGILIGLQLNKSQGVSTRSFHKKPDKLDGILSFIEAAYVDTVNRGELEEVAIPQILEHLDPHSIYIPARDVQRVNEPLEGNFDGIGVSFTMPDDTVVIGSVISGGPSEKIGLAAGDRIIEINDEIVAGVKIHQDSIVKRLKGPRGTKVKVGISRHDVTEIIEFTITRDKIPLYSVDVAYMVNDSTGYIKITKFARTTYDEFMDGLTQLKEKGMNQLIVDLRSNGGGYMDAAIKLANQFLEDETLIVYTEGRTQTRENFYADGSGNCKNGDIVILMDEWSASASEIVAGAIQDNDRGTIIGRRSFGKGLVQEPLMLSDGSAIRLTVARYYTPTGRCIQKPYNKGYANYMHDLQDRFVNGEFEKADSIHFNDSLKYTTPKGKIVYGGGGIMPDVFIPIDTSWATPYFLKVRNKGIIYKFAFEYSDKNRTSLELYKTPEKLKQYLESQHIYTQFNKYANKNGVLSSIQDKKESQFIISTQIKAYIGRNILDNAGFYPIWKDIDQTLLKAIEYISKPETMNLN